MVYGAQLYTQNKNTNGIKENVSHLLFLFKCDLIEVVACEYSYYTIND